MLKITWLQDMQYAFTSGYAAANLESDGGYDDILVLDSTASMGWDAAMAWANQLTYDDSVRGVTYDDWRLPTTLQPDGSCRSNPSTVPPSDGYDCTGSELGYMFYKNLGGKANQSVLNQNGDTEKEKANLALFTNIYPSSAYWSGTEYTSDNAWYFSIAYDGGQFALEKSNGFSVWAVRDGDVATAGPPSIPEPGSLTLVGLGLVGLGWARRRRG